MIEFNSVTAFSLNGEDQVRSWLETVIDTEDKIVGDIQYIFCDDEYLHKLNVDFLNHDTLTDVISFDYSEGSIISGDIYISIERVRENAVDFKTGFKDELRRVMVHGILHYCGYKDKSAEDVILMREKEDYYLSHN